MIDQLVEKIKKTKAPVVVGLDPMLSYIPEWILKDAISKYGETMEAAGEAIWVYNKGIVDAVYDLIPACKNLRLPCMSSLEFRDLWLFRKQ